MIFLVAKYGIKELALVLLIAGAVTVLILPLSPYLWPLPGLIFLCTALFFRDPRRRVPQDPSMLVAPADGLVDEISEMDEDKFLKCRVVKIGIFLSVLDVHINRAPCHGTVESIHYQPGKFTNAMGPKSSAVNESNSIVIRQPMIQARILLKQIAGAIARRIVCDCAPNEILETGQKIGMIKFGSRTELFLPMECKIRWQVRLNDKVRAGETILGVFE